MFKRCIIALTLSLSPMAWALDAFDLMLQEQEAVRNKAKKERAEFVYPGPERFITEKSKNNMIALRWYAAAGDLTSQATLADLYAKGSVVPQDLKTAVYWYRLAAEYGNTYAQLMMGIASQRGWIAPPNADEANEWFRRTRKQPDRGAAMREVGQFFSDPDNAIVDAAESFRWYQKAAENGDIPSMEQMGDWYSTGEVTGKNLLRAVSWYGKAAEKESPYAEYSLGLIYLNGDRDLPFPIDYAQAMTWFQRAANRGFAAAQYELGNMYYTGLGVPSNNMLAYAWWHMARKPSNPSVDAKLAQVTEKMTMDELEQAIKAADFLEGKKEEKLENQLLNY